MEQEGKFLEDEDEDMADGTQDDLWSEWSGESEDDEKDDPANDYNGDPLQTDGTQEFSLGTSDPLVLAGQPHLFHP